MAWCLRGELRVGTGEEGKVEDYMSKMDLKRKCEGN